MKNYGERLRAARKRNGLTQTELAERLGITQKSYQRMETGNHDLKMSTIQVLCKTLDISADWLMGIERDGTPVVIIEGVEPARLTKNKPRGAKLEVQIKDKV